MSRTSGPRLEQVCVIKGLLSCGAAATALEGRKGGRKGKLCFHAGFKFLVCHFSHQVVHSRSFCHAAAQSVKRQSCIFLASKQTKPGGRRGGRGNGAHYYFQRIPYFPRRTAVAMWRDGALQINQRKTLQSPVYKSRFPEITRAVQRNK